MPFDSKRSRAIFQALNRRLSKVAEGRSPAGVHKLRTSSRRVETILSELSPGLNRNQKKLLKLLERWRRKAGRVRDLDVEAGLIYSKLRVTVSDFGSFDPGLGFRAGVAARAGLTDRWALEASVDYRGVSYDWGGSVLSGDHQARLRTAALQLGLALKF